MGVVESEIRESNNKISNKMSASETISLLPTTTTAAMMIAFTVLASGAAALYWRRGRTINVPKRSWKEELEFSNNREENQGNAPDTASTTTDDAWEERRRRGIVAASGHEKRNAGVQGKPFGSSYYFAHNNTKAKGGYKDGLRMEDYTMNGPRLLSRGGQPVNASSSGTTTTSTTTTTTVVRDADSDIGVVGNTEDVDLGELKGAAASKGIGNATRRTQTKPKPTLTISRYLWDDPGDAKTGIATLRIDELPGRMSTDPFFAWSEIRVLEVSADLVEKGLRITIDTPHDYNYELRLPQLYGDADKVECIPKAKRLLVKIYKRKGILQRSNLKAWPHPQKKLQ